MGRRLKQAEKLRGGGPGDVGEEELALGPFFKIKSFKPKEETSGLTARREQALIGLR